MYYSFNKHGQNSRHAGHQLGHTFQWDGIPFLNQLKLIPQVFSGGEVRTSFPKVFSDKLCSVAQSVQSQTVEIWGYATGCRISYQYFLYCECLQWWEASFFQWGRCFHKPSDCLHQKLSVDRCSKHYSVLCTFSTLLARLSTQNGWTECSPHIQVSNVTHISVHDSDGRGQSWQISWQPYKLEMSVSSLFRTANL